MKKAFLLLPLMASLTFFACKNGDDTPLSPARDLEGTWKTPFAVTHYIMTDFCPSYDTLYLAATEKRMVTWTVSEDPSDDEGKTVKITSSFTWSDYTVLESCGGLGTGIIPEVQPFYLTGRINGAYLYVYSGATQVGNFNFTTDNMEGNWDQSSCYAYCMRTYTINKELKLQRQ